MPTIPDNHDVLELVSVSFDLVEFTAHRGSGSRPVAVLVTSGPTFRQAVTFPHVGSAAGESFGDASLDEHVRRRAAEELVRLQSAVSIAQESRGA